MRFFLSILILCQGSLYAVEADFDVAIVGTSPVSLLEAIYHVYSNERVLIIEADEVLGGAWKSIDVCGIAHVDLGCHLIGSDQKLKTFFETYFGCDFVCLDHFMERMDPNHARCSNGYYFSGGCHELISKLSSVIDGCDNAVLVQNRLESVFFDLERGCVDLKMSGLHLTVKKLIVTPASQFHVDHPGFDNARSSRHKIDHLYVLLEEEGPVRFTYQNGITSGMFRAMNLTPFLEMSEGNTQLIVIQTNGNAGVGDLDRFLDALKSKGLLTEKARALTVDTYSYSQSLVNTIAMKEVGGPLIEVLDSSSFSGMSRYLDKWTSVLRP